MRTRFTHILLASVVVLAAAGVARSQGGIDKSFRDEVRKYLTRYESTYQKLWTARQDARWAAQTHIVERDATARPDLVSAELAFATFTGSIENIELSRAYLKRQNELVPVEQRQLARIAYLAADATQIAPDLVQKRIDSEVDAAGTLYGFTYQLGGREVSLAEIDRILADETDLGRRRAAWDASKTVGVALREPLVRLRWLRNEIVRALGKPDYFSYRASEYGLSAGDMLQKLDQVLRDLRPLQIELHTWARYELARRYGQPVPDRIPAHWPPDRFGEDWSTLVDVPGLDLDAALASVDPRAIVERAEQTYQGLGFDPLPPAYWERSSLFPLPAEAGFEKIDRPSTWHIDLDQDVRTMMSIVPDARSWRTAHEELGHAHYCLSYAHPEVPFTLRAGANRAFPEAIGALIALAAQQPRFLAAAGLGAVGLGVGPPEGAAPGATLPDPMQALLKEALESVVFVPWSAGTMTRFEREIYRDGLPPERWNERWWELVAQYQGIAPPAPRDERWCDAATLSAVIVEPCEHYDRALGYVLAFHLHDHIARKILDADPHDANYFGRRAVGDYLKSILRFGATVDWRAKLREKTGYELSARAMVDYFEPLRRWLVEQNQGRKSTLAPLQ